MAVLEIRNLRVRFETPRGRVQAVDQVSLSLDAGQTVALVGESGSGKSVTGYAVLGLVPMLGGVVETGEILLGGRDLLTLAEEDLRRLRGNEMSMVFQDPMTALNPYLPIGLQLAEVLEVHRGMARRQALEEAKAALKDVGIADPDERIAGYPHQLSGGMRQRALIAMALLTRPTVLIADEPTTALDVTMQAQILALLRELREQHGTAILMITHDLAVVAGEASVVHVMYAGRIVESSSTGELFSRPWHPYTRGLLDCVPTLTAKAGARLSAIPGHPPDPMHVPQGCSFQPRCSLAQLRCERERPELVGMLKRDGGEISVSSGHLAACFEKERMAAAKGDDDEEDEE